MELRYMGFEQSQNTRAYRFERLSKGESAISLIITADLGLFLEHGINIQDGPALCARKLASDLASSTSGEHELNGADFAEHVRARAAADAIKSEARSKRANRTAANTRENDQQTWGAGEDAR